MDNPTLREMLHKTIQWKQETAPCLPAVVISKDSSESADHTCEWRTQHDNLLAVKEQDNAALLARCDNAREFFCHWLLRAYEAESRDTSYEEGETLREVMRQVNQVLGFAGYEPESTTRLVLLKKSFSWECNYSPGVEVEQRKRAVLDAAIAWATFEGEDSLYVCDTLEEAVDLLLSYRPGPPHPRHQDERSEPQS